MAAPALPEEQLLELLLTLKKTTPNEARTILNSQPQIAYALMTMMVKINAVKPEVVQETLANFGTLPGAPSAAQAAAPVPSPAVATQPPSAIPPHMQTQIPPRGGTPTYPPTGPQGGYPPPAYPSGPSAPPTGPRGYGTPPPGSGQIPGFGSPHAPAQTPPVPGLSHAPTHAPTPTPPHVQQPPAAPTAPKLPPSLSGLPDDQKALVFRVLGMSRDEVALLPPADRENVIKLRSTLGLPT